jgi:hypothetical protein
MKSVNVVSYKELDLDYKLCDEIYENGTGKDIEGRYLDVEFLKIVFEDRLKWVEEEGGKSCWWGEVVEKMLESIKDLDGDVLVEF